MPPRLSVELVERRKEGESGSDDDGGGSGGGSGSTLWQLRRFMTLTPPPQGEKKKNRTRTRGDKIAGRILQQPEQEKQAFREFAREVTIFHLPQGAS